MATTIPGSTPAPGAAAPRPIPPFDESHERLREEIRGFVSERLRPHAAEWERAHSFPDEVFAWLAERGYLGLKYPREYGGLDLGYVADAVFTEELAWCGSGGLAAGIGAHIGIATPPIWKFGTEDQKQRYLAAAIRGERIGCLGITEPDAGSDVAGLRTRATRVEGGWLVNGSKMFITNGVRAHFMVTAVKTTPEGGHHGLSFLIVDRGEGVQASPIEKLGWHASDTGLITLEDVFVPEENLLGEENRGFYLIMANFQWERLLMALGSVGAMSAAFDRVWRLVSGRARRPGAPRASQSVRHRLAELATRVEAGRDLTYHALRLFVEGQDPVREVTMAKLATQRASFDFMDECLQIAGLDGYAGPLAEDLGRAARDARLGPIGGGTDEIMREILGRSIGL